MKFRNQLGPLLWITVSGVVCVDSIRAGIGTFRSPSSGFFPFWLGVVLVVLTLALAIMNLFQEERGKITDLWKGTKWGQVILFMILILIYSILLNTLGYLITTFLLILMLFCIGERKGVWIKIAIAVVVVLASHIIFCYWLKVNLPQGVFNFRLSY